MENFVLSELEQKSLTGLLYNHISFGTTLEVFGELTNEGIGRLNVLRQIFGRILKELFLADKLSQENYLLLGMTDFLDRSFLEKCVQNETNKHLHIRAKYFLKKIMEKENQSRQQFGNCCNDHFSVQKVFPEVIKIGNRLVGKGQPVYFIADIGANFDNNLEKAKRLALAARESGADVVKFQSFQAEKIVSGDSFAKMKLQGVHGSWKKPIDAVFREAEFPREWHKELYDYCKEIGVDFSSSPYDFEAVDLLNEIGVDFFKVGSGEITWPEMLQYIAKKNRPIILATGDSTLAEVDEAVRIIEESGNKNLILLQCITNYPSKIESANINVLKTYQTAFNIITGYSDHSPGDIVVLGAVALGAKVIEKHFTLSKNDKGPDHPHSMEPQEFKQMVERVGLLEKALGSSRKEVVEEEKETVIVQRRSLHVKRDIKKGEEIKEEDIIELRPAVGIPPKCKPIVIGRRVKNDIKAGEAIYWENVQ